MSLKIHVIVVSGGEYDSAWESNLCAYATRAAAETEILRLEARRDHLKNLKRTLSETYYSRLGERPELEPMPPAPTAPKRPTKESMTKYHAACIEWRKVVQPIYARNAVAEAKVQAAAVEHTRALAVELGCDESDLQMLGLNEEGGYFSPDGLDVDYTIEELELHA